MAAGYHLKKASDTGLVGDLEEVDMQAVLFHVAFPFKLVAVEIGGQHRAVGDEGGHGVEGMEG